MGIRDHPTAPRSPWQNGHAERLIGSIRRECLDHIVVFGDAHLRRIYTAYCNGLRTHLSLAKDSPGLPRGRSSADFIMNTAGYSFEETQFKRLLGEVSVERSTIQGRRCSTSDLQILRI